MQQTRVQSLGRDDPLEKGLATHSSILAWRIPMDRGAWWATVQRVAKSQTLARDGVSREVPSSALKGGKDPDSFHDACVCVCVRARACS